MMKQLVRIVSNLMVVLAVTAAVAFGAPHTYDTNATVEAWAMVGETSAMVKSTAPLAFDARVVEVRPDYILLQTDAGWAQVPSTMATFNANSVPVAYGNLRVGEKVHVVVRPFRAAFSTPRWGLLEMLGSRGTIILPVKLFPRRTLAATPVYYELPNQTFVRISLDQALALRADHGGTIRPRLPVGGVLARQVEFEPRAIPPHSEPPWADIVVDEPSKDAPETLNVPPIYLHTCRIVRVLPNEVDVTFSGTLLRFPCALVAFTVSDWGLYPVDFQELVVGEVYRAHLFGFTGILRELTSRAITLNAADGVVQIPLDALPSAYLRHTMVSVHTPAGRDERVSIEAAIALLRNAKESGVKVIPGP